MKKKFPKKPINFTFSRVYLWGGGGSPKFENHYRQAISFYRSSEYPQAIDKWHKAINNTNSQYNKALCFLNIGICYKNTSQYDSAFYYYEKSQNAVKTIDSIHLKGAIHNNIGTLCLETGAYKKAQEHLFKALKYKETTNDSTRIGSTLLNLGEVQLRLNNWNKAENYYKQSLEIREIVKDTFGILSCYINLGILEKKRGRYQKAHNYYNNVIETCKNRINNFLLLRLFTYENMGSLYRIEGKIDSAFIYYNKALLIAKKIGSRNDIAHNKNELAQLELNKKNYKSALSLSLEAFSLASENNLFEGLAEYSKTIATTYSKIKDHENAFFWLTKHIELNDSLLSLEKRKQIMGMEYEYQTQQKENKILKLTNDNLLKKAQLTRSRYITYSIASTLVLLLILGYILWYKQKQKQKLALLESTLAASETEKTRIGQYVHGEIAGRIIKMAYEIERENLQLSNKLIETSMHVRKVSHELDGTITHGELFIDKIADIMPEPIDNKKFTVDFSPNQNIIINEPHGIHLYRIIQELVTNNLKYSKANITTIKIELQENYIYLDYKDNGIGSETFKPGHGFKHIYNRVEVLKGEINVETSKNKGFKVNIHIPYKA